jgi:TRAP transporter TAXI family solute receptor
VKLIANDEVIPSLQSAWGPSLYRRIVMPNGSYPGQQADVGVVAVDIALVVDAAMDAQLAYDVTRTLFDKKAELVAIHPEARLLSLQTAIAGSPADFHPGAIRYYQEHGVWSR